MQAGESLRKQVVSVLRGSGLMPWEAFEVLALLHEADCPLPVRQIAAALSLDASGASRRVNRLLEAGWLAKCAQAHDKREVWVEPSKKGMEVFDEASTRVEEFLATALQEMTKTEAEVVFRSLRRVRKAVSKPVR